MLAEFKKSSVLQEFTQITDDLERGRQLHKALKHDTNRNIEPATSSLGLSTAEARCMFNSFFICNDEVIYYSGIQSSLRPQSESSLLLPFN